MLDLQRQNNVFVLRMTSGENRFNLAFIAALNGALDEVEKSTGPAALVTVGEGKFYSNGLDLDWMAANGAAAAGECVAGVHRIFARLTTFPVITVAAMNGHTFAAGAMWALAHDFRIMRTDRGFFCLPEADIQIPFTPPMSALIQSKLSKRAAHEAMTTAKRFAAAECRDLDIVHDIASEAEVLPKAVALAESLSAKHRPTLGAIKHGMYRELLDITAAAAASAQKSPI